MTDILQVHRITKKYGKHTALEDVTLNLPSGKIIGLL